MKKNVVIIISLIFFVIFAVGFAGSSNILQKLISQSKTCTIVVSDAGTINTLAGCTIIDQDGVFLRFEYPGNGYTYNYLIENVVQIRYLTD